MEDKDRFLELARLSAESFEQRRRYEWRLNLALWAALGAVAYAKAKEGVFLFAATWQVWLFAAMLFVAHLLYLCMVARAHRVDKAFKHYYLKRAEGVEATRPTVEPAPQVGWTIAQIVVTALVLLLFVDIMRR